MVRTEESIWLKWVKERSNSLIGVIHCQANFYSTEQKVDPDLIPGLEILPKDRSMIQEVGAGHGTDSHVVHRLEDGKGHQVI